MIFLDSRFHGNDSYVIPAKAGIHRRLLGLLKTCLNIFAVLSEEKA